MSRDLLERILKDKTSVNLEKIIKFLMLYKKDNYIYPSVLQRKFNIPDSEVYDILSLLEENNLLKMIYEVYCYKCNHSKFFEYFNEIEEDFYCDNCEDALNNINNVKVVYKVVK